MRIDPRRPAARRAPLRRRMTGAVIAIAALGAALAPAAMAQPASDARKAASDARDGAAAIDRDTGAGGRSAGSAARSAPRIVGGRAVDAASGQWRYAAALTAEDALGRYQFCGGGLMHPTLQRDQEGHVWVDDWRDRLGAAESPAILITAAHCVFDANDDLLDPSELQVVSGALNWADTASHIQPVLAIVPHPLYDPRGPLAHDVAILVLGERSRSDGEPVALLRLPGFEIIEEYQRVNAPLMLRGWGRTAEGGRSSALLREVRVPYADQQACARSYARIGSGIAPSSFCAGFVTGGYDSCAGDSGGAVTYRRVGPSGFPTSPVIHLAGIVSWGVGCARYGLQGVYTDVGAHAGWIDRAAAAALDAAGRL